MFLTHLGVDRFAEVMNTGLDGDEQVAVGCTHHDRENTSQRETGQTGGEYSDCKRGDDGVSAAVGIDHAGQKLLRGQTHEQDQNDGAGVDRGAEEHTALGRFLILGGEGALPHLGACQREDQIGNDVAQDDTVDVGYEVALVQIRPEVGEATELDHARGRDHQIDEEDQHEELNDVGVDDAKQAGRGRIDEEDDGGDQRTHLIGDAKRAAQQADNGGGGGDLRRDRAHHGERDHQGEHTFGELAEANGKKLRDRGDAPAHADLLNASGDTGEDKHADHVGERCDDAFHADGVGESGTTHHRAAADDRRADCGCQGQRADASSGDVEVAHAVDALHEVNADAEHQNKVHNDNAEIQSSQFAHFIPFSAGAYADAVRNKKTPFPSRKRRE